MRAFAVAGEAGRLRTSFPVDVHGSIAQSSGTSRRVARMVPLERMEMFSN